MAIAEWQANGGREPATIADLTIGKLIAKSWPYVQSDYRRSDGTPTQEVETFLYASPAESPVCQHAGQTLWPDRWGCCFGDVARRHHLRDRGRG